MKHPYIALNAKRSVADHIRALSQAIFSSSRKSLSREMTSGDSSFSACLFRVMWTSLRDSVIERAGSSAPAMSEHQMIHKFPAIVKVKSKIV